VFFSAFSQSVVNKITSIMAVPWKPLGSLCAAYSSGIYGFDDVGVTGTPFELNTTQSLLWLVAKPFTGTRYHARIFTLKKTFSQISN
jgi:hypothetical protein